ncbi:MAG: ABC transporter ATP-binding protein [Deltaproteobacteria bacterium]|nr:ABC transporter ATP-binding protein [Deltaproteobacteria bacterium]
MNVSRTALEIQNVSLRYEERWVLKDLSLSIQAGEFISLLGASGSGKSTLLKAIVGEIPLANGEISGPKRYAYAPQRAPLLPWLTVLENLELARLPSEGVEEFRNRAKSMLNRAGLLEAENVKAHKLSGGMRGRASVARAFLIIESRPEVLLMDEPFIGLDVVTRDLLHGLVLELWSSKKPASLFVTHDLDEAIKLSNRILVLSKDGTKFTVDQPLTASTSGSALRAQIYEALR